MSEIKINLTNLDSGISRFNTLARNWGANDTAPPVTVGGGTTVNEFEELAQVYKNLNDHMVTLASNTAAFLTDIKQSYQDSDQKAANNISGK